MKIMLNGSIERLKIDIPSLLSKVRENTGYINEEVAKRLPTLEIHNSDHGKEFVFHKLSSGAKGLWRIRKEIENSGLLVPTSSQIYWFILQELSKRVGGNNVQIVFPSVFARQGRDKCVLAIWERNHSRQILLPHVGSIFSKGTFVCGVRK